MVIYYLILIGGLALLTGSALVALRWALRTGQWQYPAKIALQIFDEEEPVGEMTDCFPSRARPNGRDKRRGACHERACFADP